MVRSCWCNAVLLLYVILDWIKIMSYTTISQCANDLAFLARLTACAAQEGHPNPELATSQLLRWPVSSASDIEAAYEYAINTGVENPGGNSLVITDQQILSVAQPLLIEAMTPPTPIPG